MSEGWKQLLIAIAIIAFAIIGVALLDLLGLA